MRTAICHYSLRRTCEEEGWSLSRLVREVENLGAEGIDFHAALVGSPADAAGRIREALADSGVVLSGLSVSNNFRQEDPEAFRKEVENIREWIRAATDIKAPICRVFGASPIRDKRYDMEARTACRDQVIEGLAAAVQEAKKHGIVLALENHGGFPCTGEEQVGVIREVNSPFLKATIDVGNYMGMGQEGHEGTRLAAQYAAYVHFKDFRKIPDPATPWGWRTQASVIGEGNVDLPACLKILGDAGYDGFVALEYEGAEDERTAVPRSFEYMKKVMAET